MIQHLFQNNYITAALILGLLLFLRTNRTFEKRITILFHYFIFTIAGLILMESFEYCLSFKNDYIFLRNITTASEYILRTITVTLFIMIVERKRRIRYLIWIPVLIESILAFTSPFTHLMFWYNEHNEFQRGILGYLPHVISSIYLLIMVHLTLKNFRTINKGETITVLFCAALCAITTVLESAFHFTFLLTDAIIISGIFYYMYLYSQTYKIDPLTGTLDRRCFYLDQEKMLHLPMSIITMDINHLKETNDTSGHLAGDEAICTFANALLDSATKGFYVYRTGGDEFIVLGIKKSEVDANHYIKDVQVRMAQTPYTAAYGYAMYRPSDSFDEICQKSDAKMYENKNQSKENII